MGGQGAVRVINRVLAAALGLVLIVGGVVVFVEIIVAALDNEPWILPHDQWRRDALRNSWSAPSVKWFFGVVCAVGALLLLLQLVRRRPPALNLNQKYAAFDVDVHRPSLERSIKRMATRVDGIASAKVRVTPARARVIASSNRRNVEGLDQRVAQMVSTRLQGLQLEQTPEIVVTVRPREERK
jgi:hypothetical protein